MQYKNVAAPGPIVALLVNRSMESMEGRRGQNELLLLEDQNLGPPHTLSISESRYNCLCDKRRERHACDVWTQKLSHATRYYNVVICLGVSVLYDGVSV